MSSTTVTNVSVNHPDGTTVGTAVLTTVQADISVCASITDTVLTLPAGRYLVLTTLRADGLTLPLPPEFTSQDVTLVAPGTITVEDRMYHSHREVETTNDGNILLLISVYVRSGSNWLPYARGVSTAISVPHCGASRTTQLYGTNTHLFNDRTLAQETVDLNNIADISPGGVWRMSVPWPFIEQTAKNSYHAANLAVVDAIMDLSNSLGLKALMSLNSTAPHWAYPSRPTGTFSYLGSNYDYVDKVGSHYADGDYEAQNASDFQDYVKFIANRYGPKGLYAIESGNEPNVQTDPGYYNMSPAAIVRNLDGINAGLAASDYPNLIVLGGSLAFCDSAYLELLYAAGLKGKCDAISCHPYPITFSASGTAGENITSVWDPRRPLRGVDWDNGVGGIDDMRTVMTNHTDEATTVWVTEYGISTCQNGRYTASEPEQSAGLRYAVRQMAKLSYVDAVIIHTMENKGADGTVWNQNFGLVDYPGTYKKPAFTNLKNTFAALHAGTL